MYVTQKTPLVSGVIFFKSILSSSAKTFLAFNAAKLFWSALVISTSGSTAKTALWPYLLFWSALYTVKSNVVGVVAV